MIEFPNCSNYRGHLQAKSDGEKFFWRVDCDVDEEEWKEIPAYLWVSLKKYHDEIAEQRESVVLMPPQASTLR